MTLLKEKDIPYKVREESYEETRFNTAGLS